MPGPLSDHELGGFFFFLGHRTEHPSPLATVSVLVALYSTTFERMDEEGEEEEGEGGGRRGDRRGAEEICKAALLVRLLGFTLTCKRTDRDTW